MSLQAIVYTVLVIIVVLTIIHVYQVKTIPRKEYVDAIFEWQVTLNKDWVNEILIKERVSKLCGRAISENQNRFNLQQMLNEKLLEYQKGTTWFSGEVEVPIATFKISGKGLLEYKGSPP